MVINGTVGDDSLVGTAGDDTISGDLGNDTLQGGDGHNLLDGGSGFDVASYENATAAIFGNLTLTGGDDTHPATGSGDVLHGGLHDFLANIEGLIGGAFNDVLSGNARENLLDGGGGDDTLSGGDGGDTLIGGSGHNVLDGGDGFDVASYQHVATNVFAHLNQGSATVSGGGFVDVLQNVEGLAGGAGNDTLIGDSTSNLLDGGGGNDSLDGGASPYNNQLLSGGSGDDTLAGGGHGGLDGGPGFDVVTYEHATTNVFARFFHPGSGSGYDTIAGGDGFGAQISNVEGLFGGSFNDTLIGDSGANLLDGGGGNDSIDGEGGDDTLRGGTGVDTVTYVNSAGVHVDLTVQTAQNTGGAGAETLSGFENIVGSGFDDTLRAGTGDHTIWAGAGNDLVYADSGTNVLYDGGPGVDTLSFAFATHAVVANLALTAPQSTGTGTKTILNFENLVGSTYADRLTGDGGANMLTGDSGDDTLSGAAGADTIEGGAGNDKLDGGTGVDTLSYQHAAAGVHVDLTLLAAQDTSGGGMDTLSGFENILGSGFDDILGAGPGDHTILAGAGADLVYAYAGTDKLDGGTGVDTLSYLNMSAGVHVDLSLAAAQNTGGAGVETLSGFENIVGSGFDDVLRAGSGDHTIQAGGGNDLVYADAGTNVLYDGGAGAGDTVSFGLAGHFVNVSLAVTAPQSTGTGMKTLLNFENLVGSTYGDNLTGDGGANVLTGGGAGDTLAGGAGADTFRYLQAADSIVATPDLIKDFAHGIDKVDLTAIRTGVTDTYGISTVGANTQLDVDLHGDGTIDLRIKLVGQGVLTAGDLIW